MSVEQDNGVLALYDNFLQIDSGECSWIGNYNYSLEYTNYLLTIKFEKHPSKK